MENIAQEKPISTYIPYTFLVAALLSVFVMSINKVELKPYETEYPAEAFLSPDFELPSLAGGKVKLSDYRGQVVFIN
ncbi:MAG: TlpA family protein disulfide reductase, partial [Nitrospinae bacterium]|nr:TlpA family protein disulfide reductase [Nitrospinota bacterium]